MCCGWPLEPDLDVLFCHIEFAAFEAFFSSFLLIRADSGMEENVG